MELESSKISKIGSIEIASSEFKFISNNQLSQIKRGCLKSPISINSKGCLESNLAFFT
jgi:hypothetical protein